MEQIVWVLHVLTAIAVIGLVLMQHGKGADMGAAFGSGASGSLFGATGSSNFLSRTTAILATVFFVTSIGLTVFSSRGLSVNAVPVQPASVAPATPAEPVAPASPVGAIPK